MTIRVRFNLLLTFLLGGLLLALLGLRQLERAERNEILAADREARTRLLDRWVDAIGRELGQFAAELAQSAEMTDALGRGDAAAVQRLVRADQAGEKVVALWVVRPDGTMVFQAPVHELAPTFALPAAPAELARAMAQGAPRFFAEVSGELLEFSGRALQPATRNGWLFLARRWDSAQLDAISALTEGIATLRMPASAPPAGSGTLLVLQRPLPDLQGRAVRLLQLEYGLPEVEQALRADFRQILVFIVFGLLVLAAMALALHSWVLRPLSNISLSLAESRREPVTPLSAEKTEFGQVAQLVLSSFDRRAELQREIAERTRAQEALTQSEAALREKIEERARLGRDLHDGVIQSLYAAGMGLAGIRSQLHSHQVEAAARLEQTRAALNETIHDLRNFIVGLEPEALKLQTFSQAVAALLETMRSMREFQSVLDLDDTLALRLSLSQRVHALQIAREAVSNALRHGAANRIEIALRQRGGLAEFVIVDNGAGFDATSSTSPGKGLLNFAQRARELDAELHVESKPGHGTVVILLFSLP